MLYVVGLQKEVTVLVGKLPSPVVKELLRYTGITEKMYGKDCNYWEYGGFVVVADKQEDLHKVKGFIDYEQHLCEWANSLDGCDYVSALYLINNEFTILLVLPKYLAHESILAELEG